MVHQSASTVVSAMAARSAVGLKSASTVVGALRARSAVGLKSASTIVGALVARSAVGARSASTIVGAIVARTVEPNGCDQTSFHDKLIYSPPPFTVAGGSLSPHRSSGLAATAASTSSRLIPGNLARNLHLYPTLAHLKSASTVVCANSARRAAVHQSAITVVCALARCEDCRGERL